MPEEIEARALAHCRRKYPCSASFMGLVTRAMRPRADKPDRCWQTGLKRLRWQHEPGRASPRSIPGGRAAPVGIGPHPEHLVKLGRGETTLRRGHCREHLGVKLNFVQGDAVMDT